VQVTVRGLVTLGTAGPRELWRRRQDLLLRLATFPMAVASVVWLAYQFWRLLSAAPPIWKGSWPGAVDLRQRYGEVHAWFSGKPVYGAIHTATYPPASYVILWPFVGWCDFTTARLVWAATSVIALAWLIRMLLREAHANTRTERAFIALMPLAMYATGAAIGNGQLMVHILPLLIGSALVLHSWPNGWRRNVCVVLLMLAALVKPSVAGPFFWIVLFADNGLLPASLTLLGYATLTVAAAAPQVARFDVLLRQWATQAGELSAVASLDYSHGNVHSWLTGLKLERWNFPASLLLLAALGVWVFRHRRHDPWLQLGVTGLVTRFLSYHGWYDDLLLLLPMIALYRIARVAPETGGEGPVSGLLLALTLPMMLAPGGQYLLPNPWLHYWLAVQEMLWLLTLGFLLWVARLHHRRGAANATRRSAI